MMKTKMKNLSLIHSSRSPPSVAMSTAMFLLLCSLVSTIFAAKDTFLIDCGATSMVTVPDGRSFQTDQDAHGLLEANDHHLVSDTTANVSSPVDSTARVFLKEATYTFPMQDSGWHWVRLHFLPLKNNVFNLEKASFSVYTDDFTLLHEFTMTNAIHPIIKEYLVDVKRERFSLRFSPQKDSAAFINALEVVAAPEKLIGDSGQMLFPVGQYDGLTKNSLETVYRVNMGGPLITSENDTLARTWVPDEAYIKEKAMGKAVSVQTNTIKYPEVVPSYIAPATVYATAVEMADSGTMQQNFNVSWQFEVEKSYAYLLRLHFCDIVSKALNDLYFNVYINGKTAISGLDLSSITNKLATPNYQDIVIDKSLITDRLSVQIGPMKLDSGSGNAILNGLEVFKMNNSANSLDGEYGPDGKRVATEGGGARHTVAAVGFAMMFGAFVGLGAMVIKWHKRPQDWQRRNSFSSWLLPLHAGDSTFMGSKSANGSNRSTLFSTGGLGRRFTFEEIKESTKNFDVNSIIGVGGFGNVYLGVLDGTQVAVKRGNPQSEQGINEFLTEIQMLSKLRHKHLVSLIGYCDENSEMILVYEYMSKGPLRDHLYGKNQPPLSWKQRLEICIGAARGLHYLHTGSAQGIIHRDVKTTNILLDDDWVAKMADFGLSKDGPGQQADHVSTAVKGSFGYLDPEYFRKQQLTDKSDVYSFGVVLLEVLCARPAINPALSREQVNLAEWAMQQKRKGMLEKIIDPTLTPSINSDSVKKFTEAAEKCLAEYGVDRPSMGDVLWNLEYTLQLQENSPANGSVAPPAVMVEAPTDETQPSAAAPMGQANTYPTGVDSVDDKSGTALLAQFNNLSGR